MKKYGIYNPAIYLPMIIIGIFFASVGIGISLASMNTICLLILIPYELVCLYFIFNSKKAGITHIFRKQSKKIKKGMDIHQVRAIMGFIESENEGINKIGEYFIYYNTNKKKRKNTDYEAVCITFDCNAKVDDISRGYRRTTTYYS